MKISISKNRNRQLENLVLRTGIKSLDTAAEGGFYARQVIRLAHGKDLDLKMSPLYGSIYIIALEFKKSITNRFGRKY